MRKTVTIELSILDAEVIMNQLFCNLGGIEILKSKAGRPSSAYETRLTKAVRSMDDQVELTELQQRQNSIAIKAHNNLFDEERQN